MKHPLLLFALTLMPVHAAQIVFPGLANGRQGDVIRLEVVATEIDAMDGLGGYDLTFTFDPAGLEIWDWFSSSAQPLGGLTFTSVDSATPGSFRIIEVSLLSPEELLARQRPDMLLLSMFFVITGPPLPPGDVEIPIFTRSIGISGELTDAFGSPLETTFVTPEPGSLALTATAVVALGAMLLIGSRRSYQAARGAVKEKRFLTKPS